jgi:hypothetical protein
MLRDFVQMTEATRDEEQNGEDGPVIRGMQEGTGRERAGHEPDRAQYQADGEQHRQRRPGVRQLVGVDQGKGDAGEGAGNDQGRSSP